MENMVVVLVNDKLLEILEEYKEQQKRITYKELTDLLKMDDTISFFVNLSLDVIRVYSSRFNCHIYDIAFEGEEEYAYIIIKKITKR
jgi:hypothetical protein